METRATRRGLVICVAGLLLFCLLLWFTLDDEGDDGSPTDRPGDASSPPGPGTPSAIDSPGTSSPTLPPDARHEPIPAPREIAYGGRVLDGDGNPLAGLTPRLWGRVGKPSGKDGSFSVPLDPADVPVSWVADCLTFSKPGRQYPRVEPKPIGLHGKDEVWIPDVRGPSIQLWWLDTRKPVAGHAVSLGCRRGSYGRVLDTDRTDAEGMYLPYWEDHEYMAYLDLSIEGGVIRYVLDRSHVMAHFPLHLFVPRIDKALYLDILARTPEGRPAPDARVDVSLVGGGGGLLSFVTDGQGRGRAYFWLTDKEYDPSVAEIASWRATWKTARGTIRKAERTFRRREWTSVRRAEPYAIVLRPDSHPVHVGHLPVLVRTAGGKPVLPDLITGEIDDEDHRAAFSGQWRETSSSTALDPVGRLPRDLELSSHTGEEDCPDDARFVIRASLPNRTQVVRTVTVGEVRRARDGSSPIVLEVPEPVFCPRWIEVLDPDGKPIPFARCFVATPGRMKAVMTDTTGRAFLGRIPADKPCRIVVVDPITGAGGEIRELDLRDAPKVTRLELKAPRQIQLRLFRPNGNAPGGVNARLVDRVEGRALAPMVRGVVTDDNLLTFPPAALSLYDLAIKARNVKFRRIPAAEVGESLLLD